MSPRNKPDTSRSTPQDFFRRQDAIWLTDAAARELKEKQSAVAAPKIRDKPATSLGAPQPPAEPAHRAAHRDYGPTKIVHHARAEPPEPAGPDTPAPAKPWRLPAGPWHLPAMFGALRWRRPATTAPPRPVPRTRPKKDRSDFVVGALGLVLGVTCALFPWYIFFNQEKFGVREFVFSGERGDGFATRIAYQPVRIGQPFSEAEVPKMALDLFPTATTAPQEAGSRRAVPVSEQPFPADLVSYQLVHVANGRAMIMDDAGLWVVQPGSQLPDASRVASIEKRGESWVIVTTLDRVIELQP